MRLSSSSLEIASARISCSERSANRFMPDPHPWSPDRRMIRKACAPGVGPRNAGAPNRRSDNAADSTARSDSLEADRAREGRVTMRQDEDTKKDGAPGGGGAVVHGGRGRRSPPWGNFVSNR